MNLGAQLFMMNAKNVVNDSLLIPQQQIMNSSEGESKVHIDYQPQGKFDYTEDPTLNGKAPPAPIYRVFRFADRWDYLMMIIGFACSIGSGAGIVLYANPYGDLMDAFAPGAERNALVEKTRNAVFGFLKNSILVFFSTWVMNSVWTISSQRQAIRCRIEYFKGLLKQEPAWHDRQSSGEVADKMYNETKRLHAAIGSNLSSFIMSLNMILSGMVVSLTKGWKMALVMMSLTPVAVIVLFISNAMNRYLDRKCNHIMDRASGNSTEVLENIRTVKALGGEDYEVDNYMLAFEQYIKTKLCFEWLTYFVNSIGYWVILLNYCLGFWFASYLVGGAVYNDNTKSKYTVGDAISIFFIVYGANLTIGNVISLFKSLNEGCQAAGRIFSIIDRKTLIDDGQNQCPVINEINFKNVTFHYESPLFENATFKIKKGRTAFVGESGSGKSTTISLIMRFYDPFSGTINFNDLALPEITLHSLREAIGYVGQEPVLIGKTIREALLAQNRTDVQIIKALKAAEAWNFVKDIGIDSQYGQLSGGQKQRIAIARALIKSPQILILDEATSALDRTNEHEIQQTIDKLEVSFVLMIAHKIQTISNADWIYVLDKGKIVQQGTFQELLQDTSGRFYELAKNQRGLDKKEEEQEVDLAKKQSVKEEELLLLRKQKSQKQEQERKKKFKCSYIGFLFKLNINQLPAFLGTLICASFMGCVFPLYSYYIANEIVILSNLQYRPESERPYYHALSQEIAFKMFYISIAGYISCALKHQLSSIVYNELLTKLRRVLYTKLTRMKISYFDKHGSLTGIMNDAGDATGLGSHTWTSIIENLATMVCGLTIAFYHCWEITLVSLGVIPFILISAKIQMHFRTSFGSKTDEVNKKCHGDVIEALLHFKTIASFNLQERYTSKYETLLQEPLKISVKSGNISGLTFGLAQAVIMCTLAAIFFVSSIVIRDRGIGVLEVYIAIYAIMFSTMNAGGNLGFIGSIATSKIALSNVMNIIESKQYEDSESGAVSTLQGRIEFKNVVFKYPQRKTPVLNGVSFVIEPGQKVAFVGSSGCGKSTAISLLLRLYEPVSGQILVDDRAITEYNLKHLRLAYGVVTQQPVLFNRTVYENIRYNNLSLSLDEVVNAAKKANALDFIMAGNFGLKELNRVLYDLEGQEETRGPEVEAFSRKVGNRGSFLSGGQKQRVAVARAIARHPRIMLLDEATSALDSKNEEEVQIALDNISGITQVVVAHRLSTIKNCDKILVFNQGQIIQQGTFEELIDIRGYFYKLAQGQAKQNA